MNQLTVDQIEEAIQSVIKWFKTVYTQKGKFPVYDIKGETGTPLSRRDLMCEFDDYAPFFWYLGEKDYILAQTRILSRKLKTKKLFFTRPQIRQKKGLGLPGPFRFLDYADIQDYTEILYGLIELYTMSQRTEFLVLAEELFDLLVYHFERNGVLQSFRLMPFGPTFRVADAMAGMFIEIALDLSQWSRDEAARERYFSTAQRWLNVWTDTPMFLKYNIFPSVRLEWPLSVMPFIRKKAQLSELAKPNASMGYGILSMAAPPFSDPEALSVYKTWIQGLYKHFSTGDCVLTHVPRLNDYESYGPILSTNFAILDILCDAVYLFECQESRDLAISIANYFLDYQSRTTGLVPDKPGEERSYLDANTDFAVSLAKLSEITGEMSYRDAGRAILHGILTHHRCKYGYYRDIDLNTAEPLSDLVETRFCSLLLKPLILYRDELTIYGDEGNWSLFRDR